MTRIVPFILILALAACSRDAPEAPVDSAADSEATSAEAAASEAPGGVSDAPQASPAESLPAEDARPVPERLPAVVAYVNDEAITGADVENALADLEARAGQPVPADQRDGVVRGVLDQLIGYRLLLQESILRRVAVSEAAIDARIAELRAQFPSEEAFAQMLELRQMTLAMLRADTRQGLQVDAMLLAELAGDASVTAEQVTEFYENNSPQFQQGERVRASHILIGFPEDADDEAKEQARLRALGVLMEVNVGEDFAALAKQYSDDPGSAPNGGDLGYFERGQMVGSFEQVAFSLEPGRISDLVESPFGYHIIVVSDKQAPRTVPLAEAREQIEQFLEGQNRELQTRAFVETLRAKSTINIYI